MHFVELPSSEKIAQTRIIKERGREQRPQPTLIMKQLKNAFHFDALHRERLVVLNWIEPRECCKSGVDRPGKVRVEVWKQFHSVLVLRQKRLSFFCASKKRQVFVVGGLL